MSEARDYRFRARDVSSDAERAWLRDPLADALAPVDHASLGTAIGAPPGAGPWLVHGDWVWMAARSPDGLVRRHRETGHERRSTHGVLQMAASDRAAWAMTAERELLILPLDGSDPVAIGHAPARASVLQVHRGRLWLSPGTARQASSRAWTGWTPPFSLVARSGRSPACTSTMPACGSSRRWRSTARRRGCCASSIRRRCATRKLRGGRRPEWLFARSIRVWDDNGRVIADDSVALYNLMEDVQACGYGLPANPIPDDDGIVWF